MATSDELDPDKEPQDPLAAGRYYLARLRGIHRSEPLRTAETVEDWAVRGLSPGSPENLAALRAQQQSAAATPTRISRVAQRRRSALPEDSSELGLA
ncbi:MAG TPA: hypothetical protein VHU91_02910 [Mycobacteriales bacterium]|jgi:anti-sigma-K factor RskA|nr:hypothetical protein [Mycobacteriales bacterium]